MNFNFASPDRLMWLLIVIPVILFYLLKIRPKRHQVSTLLFWEQLFDQKRQRAWWQRLRHPLSLFLQLLFVLLVVGSLLDPLWSGKDKQARKLVMVIDNSASMQAIDPDGSSRFDAAIAAARATLKDLRPGDEMGIVTAGGTVDVVIGMTDFVPALDEAIKYLRATDGPTKVTEAIELGRRLCGASERREVIVFSDGCFSLSAELREAKDISWNLIGDSIGNVGITAFQARRSLVDPVGYAAMIEVQNASDDDRECRLTIKLDEALVDVIPLSLSAGKIFRKTIQAASQTGGTLVASLDADDALSVDNVARSVVTPCLPIPITLVTTRESVYLQKVFEAIPLVELTVSTVSPVRSPANGITVFHGSPPAGLQPDNLPLGAVMVINPERDGEFWKIGQSIESALVAKQSESSPIVAHVRLVNVMMPASRTLVCDDAEQLLTTSDGQSLMTSMVRDRGRLIVMGMNIDDGELPLRIAFPIMMTNAVNWFLGRTGELPESLTTGEVTTVPVGEVTSMRLQYRDPTGEIHDAVVRDDAISVGPVNQVGLITVEANSESKTSGSVREFAKIAVNLGNAGETDLRRPQETAGLLVRDIQDSGQHPIWIYLCLLALGLMVGEWYLYQRRIVG